MDLVVNEGTYDKSNISGQCKLCILKRANFVLRFLTLCFLILIYTAKSLKNTA